MNSHKTRRQKLIDEITEKVCRQLEEDFKTKKSQEKGKKSDQTSTRPKDVKRSKDTKTTEKTTRGHGYGASKVVRIDPIGV